MQWLKRRKGVKEAAGKEKRHKKNFLEGTPGTIIYVFLGVFLALGINLVLGQALSTDMPVVAVESNSMIPTFYQGDILIIQGTQPPENYKSTLAVGDVIVFSVGNRNVPIVHRIKQINPDGSFQTQGDANTGQHSFEKSIVTEQIHGKVVAIIPYLGWVKIGVTEYIVPFLLKNVIMVAVLCATVIFLYLMVKEYR
jgi:signal peptidase I